MNTINFWIDTHVHLYAQNYQQDLAQVIEQAKQKGVTKFYLPNIDETSLVDLLKVSEKYPDCCLPMWGLHPCSVDENYQKKITFLEEKLPLTNWVAIGEIGIDLYHETQFLEQQKKVLIQQLFWAKKLDLPVVFHVRKGLDEVLEILQTFLPFRFRGIFHCFGGSLEEAQKILKMGDFKLGIGGVVTFKNAHLAKIIPQIGIDNIVLETDGPYLAPDPFRGQRNEPQYIPIIAEKIATLLNVSLLEVAQKNQKNVDQIFNKKHENSTR